MLATIALLEGDASAATKAVEPTLHGRADAHHVVVLVRSFLIDAVGRQALGDPLAAENSVERGLDLAEEDSLVLPFLHAPSRELLEHHPRHRTAHAAFIDDIPDVIKGRDFVGQPGPVEPLIEPLTDAELRVLRYLPTNLSAAGIAKEIYVSVNIVRTHMGDAYAKLGVHNRTEAVERARALGLLGHSARYR